MDSKSQKKYGNLTADQFSRIIAKLPEIRNFKDECQEILGSLSKDKLEEILVDDYSWAEIYEGSLSEHIALLILILMDMDSFKEIVKSDDPHEELLNYVDNPDNTAVDDSWYSGGLIKQTLLGLTFSLQRTIISIMIYHKSLSALVEEVRHGNDKSFFDAVRIDPVILTCSTFSDRLAKAVLLDDKKFLLSLRKALKGPSGRHWKASQDIRYAIALLRSAGLDSISDKELEDLFVHRLKIYPDTFNARKNLRMQFWKSKSIISNGNLR